MEKAIILSAPSGAGKTTIVRHLLSVLPELSFSVSATTRAKRAHEIDGIDYYFLDVATFLDHKAKGNFLESEEVYEGLYYGTLKSEIERIWQLGKTVIFDVDVKGGINLKKYFGSKSLAIFVKPPSLEVLKERLTSRNTETPESLAKRIEKAEFEMSFEKQFDVTLVNNHLNTTFATAERMAKEFLEGKV